MQTVAYMQRPAYLQHMRLCDGSVAQDTERRRFAELLSFINCLHCILAFAHLSQVVQVAQALVNRLYTM